MNPKQIWKEDNEFIRRIMLMDPGERPTAKELLKDERIRVELF